MGRISDTQVRYSLKAEPTKLLLNGKKKIEDIEITDLALNIEQKGVDMRIGIDISSLAFKKTSRSNYSYFRRQRFCSCCKAGS